MRIYLEALETAAINTEAEFVRADVTGMGKTEVDAVKAATKDVMSGRTYTFQRHTCRHEESGVCDMAPEL